MQSFEERDGVDCNRCGGVDAVERGYASARSCVCQVNTPVSLRPVRLMRFVAFRVPSCPGDAGGTGSADGRGEDMQALYSSFASKWSARSGDSGNGSIAVRVDGVGDPRGGEMLC